MSTYLKSIARRFSPSQIPVFPLTGTVLMPGCELPLNIFEPRYLNMVDDALRSDRLIGIVQPAAPDKGEQRDSRRDGGTPDLEQIGTLGRIKQFSETDDGRYLISLIGLKRFKIIRPAPQDMPYRQALVSYEPFKSDIDVFEAQALPNAMTEHSEDRVRLTLAMKLFAKSLNVEIDWKALERIALASLVDQSVMISPFNPQDKQSLLEAKTEDARRQLLIGLMELYAGQNSGQYMQSGRRDN